MLWMPATTSTRLRTKWPSCASTIWASTLAGRSSSSPANNPKTFFFYNMEWRRYITGGLFNVTVPLANMYPDANGADTGVVLPGTLGNGNAVQVVVPANIASLAPTVRPGFKPAGISAGATVPQQYNSILRGQCQCDLRCWARVSSPSPPADGNLLAAITRPLRERKKLPALTISSTINSPSSGTGSPTRHPDIRRPPSGAAITCPRSSTPSAIPRTAVVHATYIIRPNLLNEVAFNYNGNRIHILPAGCLSGADWVHL